MTIRLATLTDADAEPTARWREAARANLRTPYVRSVEEQRAFIAGLPAHRMEYRYWAVQVPRLSGEWQTVGIAGLSPICWENGIAEVSLVLDPARIGKGYGGQALRLLLSEAFDNLRLTQVVAEVYAHNPALGFWEKQAGRWGATRVVLPARKFWNFKYHDGIYFAFQWKAK
jgi:RimJ/RimL family protein N-acetyltransferase